MESQKLVVKDGLITEQIRVAMASIREAGHRVWLVGDCVRDIMLGLEPEGYELVTDAEPHEVDRCVQGSVLLRGQFVTVTAPNGKGDHSHIVTLRRKSFSETNMNCYGNSILDDVQRRDFTINGLYYDATAEQVWGLRQSFADIHSRVLRTINDDLEAAFEDQPVLLLKAIRLASQFDLSIPEDVFNALKSGAPLLASDKRGKIGPALRDLLLKSNCDTLYPLLDKLGFFQYIFTHLVAEWPSNFVPLSIWMRGVLKRRDLIKGFQKQRVSFISAALAWPIAMEAYKDAASTGQLDKRYEPSNVISRLGLTSGRPQDIESVWRAQLDPDIPSETNVAIELLRDLGAATMEYHCAHTSPDKSDMSEGCRLATSQTGSGGARPSGPNSAPTPEASVMLTDPLDLIDSASVPIPDEHGLRRIPMELSKGGIPDALLSVVQKLNEAGFKAWLVGECVRDIMWKREPERYELLTDGNIEETRALFQIVGGDKHRMFLQIGLMHALTLSCLVIGSAKGKKRSRVVSSALAKNLLDRSFTVNTLCYDMTSNEVCGTPQALEDMLHRIARPVVTAGGSYAPNTPKIWRILHLAADCGLTIASSAVTAICGEVNRLGSARKQRNVEPLTDLLLMAKAETLYKLLDSTGVFKKLCPLYIADFPGDIVPLCVWVEEVLKARDRLRLETDKQQQMIFVYAALVWPLVIKATKTQKTPVGIDAEANVYDRVLSRVDLPVINREAYKQIWKGQETSEEVPRDDASAAGQRELGEIRRRLRLDPSVKDAKPAPEIPAIVEKLGDETRPKALDTAPSQVVTESDPLRAKAMTFSQDLLSGAYLHAARTLQRCGFKAFLVGRTVRDLLWGRKPEHYRLVTDALSAEIMDAFCRGRKTADATLIPFGKDDVLRFTSLTSTATAGGAPGKKKEDYKEVLVRDLLTREPITINALLYELSTKKVWGFVQSFDDIAHRVLRPVIVKTTGPVWQSRAVINALCLASRFDLQLSLDMSAMVQKYVTNCLESGLTAEEAVVVNRLFLECKADTLVSLMESHGLLSAVLPTFVSRFPEGIVPLTLWVRKVTEKRDALEEHPKVRARFVFAALTWPIVIESEKCLGVGDESRFENCAAVLFRQCNFPTAFVKSVARIWQSLKTGQSTAGDAKTTHLLFELCEEVGIDAVTEPTDFSAEGATMLKDGKGIVVKSMGNKVPMDRSGASSPRDSQPHLEEVDPSSELTLLHRKIDLPNEWIPAAILGALKTLSRNGFRAWLVGGCVRDMMMGVRPKDYDIVTDARPTQVKNCIPRGKIVGKLFTVVVVPIGAGDHIDIATLRRGYLTPDRNLFGNTLVEDVVRRDFTINALYYSTLR